MVDFFRAGPVQQSESNMISELSKAVETTGFKIEVTEG